MTASTFQGIPNYRRVDIGEYRICYTVMDSIIRIVVVGKRNDDSVYSLLKQAR